MKKIPFNRPYSDKRIQNSLNSCLSNGHFSGDGILSLDCSKLLAESFGSSKVLLTTSCTHSLEMTAILAGIQKGDEVIMPSYTFVSTANAFVLRGATVVFVDVRPDTMNIDESLLESAITSRTKAIVPVHYAGIGCEMDVINKLAKKYNLIVIEDAAQGVFAKYNGKFLGALGDMGCYSFHETKNFQCGEGGAILLNNSSFIERAEIIREKGTDRSRFFRGLVDKYTWQDVGSSYLLSEINAAFLLPQLLNMQEITDNRLSSWEYYFKGLSELSAMGRIALPVVPQNCEHNAHMFYLKTKSKEERTELMNFLNERQIQAIFHYIPLHSSPAGQRFGRFHGEDKYTTSESEKLLRLPLFYGISRDELDYIIDNIKLFFLH